MGHSGLVVPPPELAPLMIPASLVAAIPPYLGYIRT